MYRHSYNKRAIGHSIEQLAGRYLSECGLDIIEYNYRNRSGEIDIIARDGKYIVFIEVKYRTSSLYGKSIEAVNSTKQKTIRRVAAGYMIEKSIRHDTFVRFDVVGIDKLNDKLDIKWIKNAF